jgi:hypothetical protein
MLTDIYRVLKGPRLLQFGYWDELFLTLVISVLGFEGSWNTRKDQ